VFVLAFDTTGSSLSLALIHGDKVLTKTLVDESNQHSELLIPEIEKILRSQNIWYQNLGLIVATKGPGSFTGTRVGLTAARILRATLNIPLILLPSDVVAKKEAGEIGLLGLQKFHEGESSSDMNPIYSIPPRISERKK